MKHLVKYTLLSMAATGALYAGGYKIPETSTNAIALSSATVAHSHGADSAYYNPANMVFMQDKQNAELDLIYIGLDPVHYKSDDNSVNIHAESENFYIPSFHYVSKKLGDKGVRVGMSVVVPGGLSKRWNSSPAVDRAKEFTLETVEVNPTVAYSVTNNLAIAFGFRVLYSSGVVKSASVASRDMTGDSIDFGYNLALAYKPIKNLEIGITYRSEVDMTIKGNAKLSIGNALVYDGGANVTIPLPSTFNAAVAYTFASKTTIEFVYERVGWSAYKNLNFDYVSSIPPILQPSFDASIPKNWKDTNVYRLGLTQQLKKYTLMAGVVLDKTPVPENTMSFELPDSDSVSVSAGMRYQYNENINIGLSALYSMRNTRQVNNNDVNGKFSNADILLVSAGIGYKF